MRFAKQKGGAGALEAHHERTKEKYASNPDIDTSRSKYNFHIVQPETSYKRESDNRIEAAGCKTRKDSVRFVDTLITASPDFFKNKKREEIREFFKAAVEFLSQKIGRGNIFSAVVHLDEKTPHMHLCFTPITEDGRLSAKEIIGNRTQLTRWQDGFFNHMVKKFPNIERGESASVTGRRHILVRVFKQAVHLTRKAAQIQSVLTASIRSTLERNVTKPLPCSINSSHLWRILKHRSGNTSVRLTASKKTTPSSPRERRLAKRSALAGRLNKTSSALIMTACGSLLIRCLTI
jgi:hypothetical protein